MTVAPSRLEYGYAFDLATSWLGSDAFPLLAVVSTPEFVDHVSSRIAGPMAFACDDDRTYDYARQRLAGSTLPGDVAAHCQVLPPVETVETVKTVETAETGWHFAAALWASPQPASWQVKLAAVDRLLAPGGAVCILTATLVGRLTRPLRRRWQRGEPAPLAGRLRTQLAGDGWQVTRSRALGGVASLGWAIAGRIATVAGRPDLTDRAERAHHRAVESEVGASYTVLLARREGLP